MNDNITKPMHYTNGSIETIDYIRDKLTPEQFEGYCIGNVHKYISRYKLKNGVEDLEKAKVYLAGRLKASRGEAGENIKQKRYSKIGRILDETKRESKTFTIQRVGTVK